MLQKHVARQRFPRTSLDDPLSGFAASPKGDDAIAARRLLLGVSHLEHANFEAASRSDHGTRSGQ
ncbi:hypothetical protein DZC30_07165 [Comamonas testosteroni]|uniref:Uncharacterized protein n=1 Tax=Comamonas testosteroni TaxID=285 RepID=A0A373FNJ6_COMTE|nr:hypothetical protein DZC30_07165 [Comamonas testosteroni]